MSPVIKELSINELSINELSINKLSLKELPLNQRVQLVEDIWDSIAADQGALSLTDEQREELDLRLGEFISDGFEGDVARTVLTRIRKRL